METQKQNLVFRVGSFVNRGRVCGSGVSGSLVSGSWFVVFLDVFGVFGLSLELDISGVSILVSSVGHNLGAAIGESNAVGSGDDVVVGFLVVLEIVVRFLILNVVSEAVRLGSLFLNDEKIQIEDCRVLGFHNLSFLKNETYISGFLVFRSRCLVFGGFVLGSVVSGGSDGDESGEDDEL